MSKAFDVIIMTTPSDYLRVKNNIDRIIDLVPGNNFYIVGSSKVGELINEEPQKGIIKFIDENSIIPFDNVHSVIKEILGEDDIPRGVTGWYYQQFLKMKYAEISDNDYYMSWDGDTVPCKAFGMFDEKSGKPYFDVKSEYHEEYFITMNKLFPDLHKVIRKSFISEHMLFDKKIMSEIIDNIEDNTSLAGTGFYEKILRAIRPEKLLSNSFSEFETYGTYVASRYQEKYRIRFWHSIRYGSMYFLPSEMTEETFEWLGKDFDAISFEKNQEIVPELAKYFNTPEYRAKLSARYIIETIQDCSSDGLKETWD